MPRIIERAEAGDLMTMNDLDGRIDALIESMTLEEKVALAAGSGLWYSTGIERLGIPAFKLSDGPNGVRETVVAA